MACGSKVLSERQFRRNGRMPREPNLWHANMPNVRIASGFFSPSEADFRDALLDVALRLILR